MTIPMFVIRLRKDCRKFPISRGAFFITNHTQGIAPFHLPYLDFGWYIPFNSPLLCMMEPSTWNETLLVWMFISFHLYIRICMSFPKLTFQILCLISNLGKFKNQVSQWLVSPLFYSSFSFIQTRIKQKILRLVPI